MSIDEEAYLIAVENQGFVDIDLRAFVEAYEAAKGQPDDWREREEGKNAISAMRIHRMSVNDISELLNKNFGDFDKQANAIAKLGAIKVSACKDIYEHIATPNQVKAVDGAAFKMFDKLEGYTATNETLGLESVALPKSKDSLTRTPPALAEGGE